MTDKPKIPGLAKAIGFALVPALALLALLECALWALGVGEDEARFELSRGFSRDARYLVPDPETPGGWKTQGFQGKADEIVIPPKSDSKRVVLFGGSNTRGFPGTFLERYLNWGSGETDYEVLNLGCPGYGSYRTSIMFEQALDLDPDVVVIYSGHNEFVEYSFELDLDEYDLGLFGWPLARLRRLRTFRAATILIEPAVPTAATTKPEAWAEEYRKFKRLDYADTLRVFHAYAENLERMCRLAEEHGVGVVLCTVVSNQLSPPNASNPPAEISAEQQSQMQQLLTQAGEHIPRRFRPLAQAKLGRRLGPSDWNREDTRAPPGFKLPVLRAYTGFLDREQTWLPEIKHWSGHVFPFFKIVELFCARELSSEDREEIERAVRLYEVCLDVWPRHANALFELGICVYLLGGDDERAARLLAEAERYDCAPRKATPVSNEIVRDIAGRIPEVRLFDVAALFATCAPSGIVGFEVMQDQCHIHPRVRNVLMGQFAPIVRDVAERSHR